MRRPSLVVVPLSTLRNWEREFATWAPQIHTVTFVGNIAARNVVRQYELYARGGRGGRVTPPVGGRTERMSKVLPEVILTSYEMLLAESGCEDETPCSLLICMVNSSAGGRARASVGVGANRPRAHRELRRMDFEVLIVDEGHRLKNRHSR